MVLNAGMMASNASNAGIGEDFQIDPGTNPEEVKDIGDAH